MPQRKPTIIEQQITADKAVLTLQIDPEIEDFQGHFPENPLLPGVTQLDWAIFYGKKLLNCADCFTGIDILKFQEPILPGYIVILTLTWDAANEKLHFNYRSQSNTHSSGRICLVAGE